MIVSILPELPWTIELRISGGFEGILMRSIKVSSSGEVTIFDEKTNQTLSPELSGAEFELIRDLFTQIEKIPQAVDSNCMDCYQYELEIFSGDAEFNSTFTDENLAGSEISPLISELRNIMNNVFQQ